MIEDPDDLPKTNDLYLVTLINKETKEIDTWWDGTGYDPEYKVWRDEAASYKPSANGNWVVVAWAKFPAHYLPQKLQGG